MGDKMRLGELLVVQGYLTKEQLQQALEIQQRPNETRLLGQILVSRGLAADVDMVFVAGEMLVQNGKHIKLDRDDLVQRLKAAVPEDYAEQYREKNRLCPELRKHVQKYFADWYAELDAIEKKPFYFMNNRQ